jgi:hypothetical protein
LAATSAAIIVGAGAAAGAALATGAAGASVVAAATGALAFAAGTALMIIAGIRRGLCAATFICGGALISITSRASPRSSTR